MNPDVKAFPLSAQWDVTLKNTSCSPWQSERLCQNTIELRAIRTNVRHGQFLMLVDRAQMPETRSQDAFWASAPGKAVLSKNAMSPRRESRLWVDLPAESYAAVRSDLEDWCARLTTFPGVNLHERLSRVTVIIGPSMPEVTDGMGEEEACMVPRREADGRLAFVVMINHPQPRMNRQQEREWLRCALAHELEHVWQFLAARDSRLELPWASFSEMCATYAEHRDHPSATAYLNFGAEYLRRLPDGLLTGSTFGEIERPYWWFPFVHHLEECCPDIHRELWLRKGELGPDRVASGPWLFIDHLLRAHNSSLAGEWLHFCQLAVQPVPSHVTDAIRNRFPSRLPTMSVDLAAAEPDDCAAHWEFRVLSGHWIRVHVAPEMKWSLKWTVDQAMPNAEFSVSTSNGSGRWETVAERKGDHAGEYLLNSEIATQNILFVHAFAPDMSRLYDRAQGGEVQSLDPAWLKIRFVRD